MLLHERHRVAIPVHVLHTGSHPHPDVRFTVPLGHMLVHIPLTFVYPPAVLHYLQSVFAPAVQVLQLVSQL